VRHDDIKASPTAKEERGASEKDADDPGEVTGKIKAGRTNLLLRKSFSRDIAKDVGKGAEEFVGCREREGELGEAKNGWE